MIKYSEWALKITGNVETALDKINGKADGTSRKFMQLQDKIGGMESRFGGLKSIIAGALSGIAVTAFLNSSVTAFDSQEKANAQLQASLTSTKAVAGKTFSELEEAASKLQKVTLFEDDQTMGAQALMLTFTKVRGEIYDKSIPAILDYATAMKTEPQAAALALGKALNDPIQGITSLRRAGVQFSDSQKEMIEKFTKTNQLAKAQEIILGELETQFGGSAEAAAKAGMGPLILAQHAFMDVMEKVGLVVAKVFMKLLPFIYGVTEVVGTAVDWIIKNIPLITDILTALGIGILVAAGYLLYLNGATLIYTASMWLLTAAMTANPIGIIVVAIIAFVGAIVLAYQRVAWFRGALNAWWEGYKAIFLNMAQLAKDILGGIGEMFQGIINPFENFDKIKSGFGKLTDAVFNYGKSIKDAAVKGYEDGATEIEKKLSLEGAGKMVPEGTATGKGMAGAAEGLESDKALKKGNESITEGGKQIRNFTINIGKMIEKNEIHTTNLKNGDAQELTNTLLDSLVRVVQGVETAAG